MFQRSLLLGLLIGALFVCMPCEAGNASNRSLAKLEKALQNKSKTVSDVLAEWSKYHRKDARFPYYEAMYFLASGDRKMANAKVERALALKPKQEMNHQLQLMKSYLDGKPVGPGASADDIAYFILLSKFNTVRLAESNFEEANWWAGRAVSLAPSDSESILLQSAMLVKLRKFDDAVAALKTAVDRGVRDSRQLELFQSLLQVQKYERIKDLLSRWDYTTALEEMKDLPDSENKLTVAVLLGDLSAARRILNKLVYSGEISESKADSFAYAMRSKAAVATTYAYWKGYQEKLAQRDQTIAQNSIHQMQGRWICTAKGDGYVNAVLTIAGTTARVSGGAGPDVDEWTEESRYSGMGAFREGALHVTYDVEDWYYPSDQGKTGKYARPYVSEVELCLELRQDGNLWDCDDTSGTMPKFVRY